MSFIRASWPAPSNVIAGITDRHGGHSFAEFNSFNLGQHVGDDAGNVELNRRRLAKHIGTAVENIQWLDQVHGNKVFRADKQSCAKTPKADAVVTAKQGLVCTVMTADCLPILLCDKYGREVAAIHAGWRSLANDVIDNTVNAMHSETHELIAWLGPAISPRQFEVGEDVKEAFVNSSFGTDALKAFKPIPDKEFKYLANIYRLAKMRLRYLGVTNITGKQYCTVEQQQWYSYRRDGLTGRMASFIMIR